MTPSDFEFNFHPQFAKTYAYLFSIGTKVGFGKRQRNVFFKTIDDGRKEIVLVPFPVRMKSEFSEFRFDLYRMDRIFRIQLIPGFEDLSQCHQLREPFIRTLYSPAHETFLRTRQKTQFVKFLSGIIQFLLQYFIHFSIPFFLRGERADGKLCR